MNACYPIRERLNLAIAAALLGATLLGLLALPFMVRATGWTELYWLLPALALATPAYWALIHEAIHHHLLPDSRRNALLARALATTYGASFHVLAFAHLMHHRFNRHWESEWYDPAQEPAWQKHAAYYATLLGGLYVGEVLASLMLAVLPARLSKQIFRRHLTGHMRHPKPELPMLAEQYFFRRNRLAEVRIDMVLTLLLYALALAAYGAAWPFLAAFVLLRALMVSLADNAYHYATPLDNSQPALELALPRWLSHCMLHFNLHRSHHENMAAPWHVLPQAHAASQKGYDKGFADAIFRQFRGPLRLADSNAVQPSRKPRMHPA